MKALPFILILLLILPMFTIGAETNQPTSSLQLSEGRSKQKRVAFLIEVGQAYSKEGNLEAAISAYERALEINPDSWQAKYLVSHIYIGTKQYEKAIVLHEELLEQRPEDFTLWNNLAWIHATSTDPSIRNGPKAVEYAHEAMTLAPYDHHVWSTLSEAHYISGDYEKAYQAIEHMAKLAMKSNQNLPKESVESYNEQIRKCRRAIEAEKALKGEDEESTPE